MRPEVADLSPGALVPYELLLTVSWEDIGRLTSLVAEAIDDYEGGDAWRDDLGLFESRD